MSKNAPLYWKKEASGKMAQIVRRFFNKEVLTDKQLNLLKWYVIQWIEGTSNTVSALSGQNAIVPPNYRERISNFDQSELYSFVSKELLLYGIDPF